MRLVVIGAALGTMACVGSILAQTPQPGAVIAIRASAYVDVMPAASETTGFFGR
jgi:hypothetical protein